MEWGAGGSWSSAVASPWQRQGGYWSVTRLASWGGAREGKRTCLQVDDSAPTSLPVRPCCPSSSLKESGQLWLEAYLHQ